MPRIVKTTVYELKELSESARERARAWYRESCLDYDWHEFVYEDFETVCGLLGVTLRTSPVRLMGGGTRQKPHIFYSGFSYQGDGASLEGTYATPGAPPGPSEPTRPRTPNCTPSPTRWPTFNVPTSTNSGRTSARAAATATSTPWRSMSSATAPPGRT